MFFVYCITTFSICKDKNLPVLIFFLWGILPVKGGRIYERKRMDAFRRSWRCCGCGSGSDDAQAESRAARCGKSCQ